VGGVGSVGARERGSMGAWETEFTIYYFLIPNL
jgi:hypothetical protein